MIKREDVERWKLKLKPKKEPFSNKTNYKKFCQTHLFLWNWKCVKHMEHIKHSI